MPGEYFEARERALLGTRYDVLYAAPCAVRRGVTVNGLRCAPQEFAAAVDFGLEPSPFCDAAFLLTDPQLRPGRHAYHHAGVFYVQEPSASVPAGLLGVRPGERVLDLCAAPGGKTSQLAAALRGEGLLVANEYVAARAGVLKSNLERMGVTNALVLNESTARVAAAFPAFFDKILVDAPCSGEGMFRKEPEALRQHSAALVAQCAALGASILDDAAAARRPGGLLCYSTCTFAPEEDEAQVGAFLARHPEFTVLPAPTNAGAPGEAARCGAHPFAAEHARRIYPCHGGEGHFMALLQKRGDGAPPEAERARPRAARGQRGAKRGQRRHQRGVVPCRQERAAGADHGLAVAGIGGVLLLHRQQVGVALFGKVKAVGAGTAQAAPGQQQRPAAYGAAQGCRGGGGHSVASAGVAVSGVSAASDASGGSGTVIPPWAAR